MTARIPRASGARIGAGLALGVLLLGCPEDPGARGPAPGPAGASGPAGRGGPRMITLDQKRADALNARRLTAVGSTLTFGAPPDTRSWPLPEGTPEWVRGPSSDELAFGVGWVRGMENEALAKAAAENRARVDLMERLVKRGRLEKGAPLEGSVITERWFHEKTNTHFAKAELK